MVAMAVDEALLRVVDHARQLHAAIDIARLERMRFIYRSWVASPVGVEGGFSLTRDELACVLESPPQSGPLDFLMAAFRTDGGRSDDGQRIDLLTLLAACACLARGPLEAKAAFLFRLVDFDTEDEIVEDELAMLVALCSDGLRRLGVVITELVDLDARAVACEAFEFVGVDDGAKMSLALFVQWLVAHWRPAALFDRIQRLHERLQRLEQETDLYCSQNSDYIEKAKKASAVAAPDVIGRIANLPLVQEESRPAVLSGPVIGVTTETCATFLLECDQDGTIDVSLTDRVTRQVFPGRLTMRRNRPSKCVIRGLSPGRVYHATARGIQTDVMGVVQTPCREPASIRILLLGSGSFCGLPVTARGGYVATGSTSVMGSIREHLVLGNGKVGSTIMYDMTIHIGAISALRHDLLRGYKVMHTSCIDSVSASASLESMIRTCYRSYATIPDVRALRSLGTNWFSGVGLLRGLIQSETPIRFIQAVAKVIQEYEDSDETLEPHDSNLIHRLASQVYVVQIDTTDCLLESAQVGFVEWPENLLTSRQLEAIKHAMRCKDTHLSSKMRSVYPSSSKQVIILCDAPFVWPFSWSIVAKSKTERDPVEEIANDPWVAYPHDLRHLLGILFEAITKNPKLRITLVCTGMFASRVVISNKSTGRSIEQLSLGTTSNIDREPPQVARYSPERALNALGDEYTMTGQAVGGSMLSLKQYCALNIVPHSQGAVCKHTFYTAGHPQARIILGPIIGRVTTRTSRILIEVDRPVQAASCVLLDPRTGHSVSVESDLKPFIPTIFKLEGLHPGTRYKVKFEGIMTEQDDIDTYIETPALSPLTVEWLVFSDNNLQRFLRASKKTRDTRPSHWERILSSHARSYQTTLASIISNTNDDPLGESIDQQSEHFNPWYHVEAFALSEPLRQTQLSIHIGGQVDLRIAFTDEELALLVTQLCDSTLSEAFKDELYVSVRFRLQEVYRNTWGVEPLRTVLGYSSNIMLLHDQTDLFFSSSRIQRIVEQYGSADDTWARPPENDVASVATRLRAIAFELWQLYQNQLSVDVNESDLDNSRRNSSKFASHLTLGMCRLVFVNISDELRDVCSNFDSAEQVESHLKTLQTHEQVIPLSLSIAKEGQQLTLLSSATWKTVDEATDATTEQDTPTQQGSRSKTKKATSSVKQLVVFLPVDLIDIVTKVPAVREEVVRLLEKLFKWKMAARRDRNVSLICSAASSSSISFTLTDEKVNESLVMTRVSSISKLQAVQTGKSTHAKSKTTTKTASPVIKGYFSKRFTYQSSQIPTGATSVTSNGSVCRSYARYMVLSDYRRCFLNETLLFFPSRAQPKIVVGPVIGRLIRTELTKPAVHAPEEAELVTSFSVPILVESNATARITCVVVDSMANFETRISREVQADEPTVFCIHGLAPLRRFVYFFEGVSNADSRRGCFHTPPAESNSLNLVAVSSNFPTHMDEEQDSLWVPLLERAKLPWCGLDAIFHLGGQVPLHEAAVECVEWANRELQREILHGEPRDVEAKREKHVRTRVRRRFQEEYHLCWNLPNIRELLAHCSHWFLRSKADVAPFFGRESPGPPDTSRARSVVLEVANEVIHAYQTQLMSAGDGVEPHEKAPRELREQKSAVESTHHATPRGATKPAAIYSANTEPRLSEGKQVKLVGADSLEQTMTSDDAVDDPGDDPVDDPVDEIVDYGGAVHWQHEDISVFVGDMREVSMVSDADAVEPITCNGRLSRPLSRQENPMMNEAQWKCFESVLRKKRTLLLVMCLELPLILTNADHVDKLREDLRPGQAVGGAWILYDHKHVLQHWVACKRQLEQLLLLLFKWKAKRSGRDVVILSGGMRIGIDTMLEDRETKLSIRNFTVGPITATVETFEFPLNGIACPTFIGGAKDDHFTFRHALVAKKSYLLLRASVDQPVAESPKHGGKSTSSESKSSNVFADFVPNEPATLSRIHPVEKFQRFPLWWTTYVPMGKAVFWDDTITLKSETDERMLLLREYVWHDRGFSGALEVFYEKYQFAETARMEDLKSRHSQHVDLRASFMAVLSDLWRAIPESKHQQMAYFLDPFVLEMLMNHVAPDLLSKRLQSGDPIELAFFSRVIRDFVFAACLLRLTIDTQQEDEVLARRAAIEKRKRDAELAALEKERVEQAAQQEAARMAELLRTDPLQYAKIKLAEEEAEKQEKLARHQEKLERKKAERLAELEEEQAIAKEQKKLNKLAERDAVEYERRQHELDARIRKLEEKRAQRAAQKKAAAEKSERDKASTEQ